MNYLRGDEKLVFLIDNFPRFAFLRAFNRKTPAWAFEALHRPVFVRVEVFEKYGIQDEMKIGDATVEAEGSMNVHRAKRKILIVKAFKDPTYLVLRDSLKYTPYTSVEEWVNDFCATLNWRQYTSFLYLCRHYGRRRPWRTRKTHVFLFIGEKYLPAPINVFNP